MPHFLAFYEKSVPMVVVWVGAEEPVVSLSCRYRHRGFLCGSNIHAGIQKAKQNMRVRRNRTYHVGTRPSGYILAKSIQLPYYQHFAGKLADIDKNIFPPNLHSVAIHADRGVLPDLAGGHVVLPSVPRAGHDLPVHDALTERPAPVEAGIVDGIELATDIGQRNGFALNLKLPDRSRRDFIGLCCSRKRHLLLSPGYEPRVAPVLNSLARLANFYFPFSIPYRGCGVSATITPFLNSSTIWGFKRTSVGRFT